VDIFHSLRISSEIPPQANGKPAVAALVPKGILMFKNILIAWTDRSTQGAR